MAEKKILVVDDDESILESTSSLIRALGYEVKTASSVEEALSECINQSFDLILSDIEMPRHNGVRLMDEVRKMFPMPVVVLMSGSIKAMEEAAKHKPPADYMFQKPFGLEEIESTLKQAFGQPYLRP